MGIDIVDQSNAWDALLGERIFASVDQHCFRAIKIGLNRSCKYVYTLESIAQKLACKMKF